MQAFEYANPTTLKEAVSLLGSRWGEADVLAGGTDLISLMKDEVHHPKRVVNVKNIRELGGITRQGGGVRIGATVTLDELINDKIVRAEYAGLADSVRGISSQQIRNMGTVGGNLCQRPRCWYFRGGAGLLAQDANGKSLVETGENRYHAIFGNGPARFVSPTSLGPALIAYGARAVVTGPNGNREIPMEKFFVSPASADQREIALAPNEILTAVIVPAAGGARSGFYEVHEREALDWPLVTASVVVKQGGGRVVLGHVAPTPWVATAAEKLLASRSNIDEAAAEEIGKAAVADAKPLSQNAYKVQLAKVAVKRALLAAAGRSA